MADIPTPYTPVPHQDVAVQPPVSGRSSPIFTTIEYTPAPSTSSSKRGRVKSENTTQNSKKSRRSESAARDRVNWTAYPLMEDEFLQFLVDNQSAQTHNGAFKEATYQAAATYLLNKYPDCPQLTWKKLRSKFDNFKPIWKEFQQHCDPKPGWSWNEERRVPCATKEVEDVYYTKWPRREKFKDRPPRHDKFLSKLFGYSLAPGNNASMPMDLDAEYSDDHNDDNDEFQQCADNSDEVQKLASGRRSVSLNLEHLHSDIRSASVSSNTTLPADNMFAMSAPESKIPDGVLSILQSLVNQFGVMTESLAAHLSPKRPSLELAIEKLNRDTRLTIIEKTKLAMALRLEQNSQIYCGISGDFENEFVDNLLGKTQGS